MESEVARHYAKFTSPDKAEASAWPPRHRYLASHSLEVAVKLAPEFVRPAIYFQVHL